VKPHVNAGLRLGGLADRNLRRVLVLVAVSIALAVAVAVRVSYPVAAGGATPVWTVTQSPDPSTSTTSGLGAVSCPSTSSCFAVGDYVAGSTKTLIERWNGTGWAITPSPNPHGSSYASLAGVSCPGSASCFAVGSYKSLGSYKTLVEHWNGTRWTIMSSPNPSQTTKGHFIGLDGVSCPNRSSCMAVGNFADGVLIEHWNGRRWSIMLGTPKASTDDSLTGVSCPGLKSCFAVGGSDLDNDRSHALVEHWNGRGAWSIMRGTPSPSGYDRLVAVSCPSTTSCFAVGDTAEISNAHSLVEHWNGRGAWSVMTAPHPNPDSALYGVSCPGTATCFAVGGDLANSWVQRWNGHGSWQTMPSPDPSDSLLDGLSCPTTTSCVAVGIRLRDGTHTKTLIERYA